MRRNPYIIRNDPNVDSASKKWRDPYYLFENFPEKRRFTERSPTNHFMYYNDRHSDKVKDWKRPHNDIVSMMYREWMALALEREALVLGDSASLRKARKMEREARRIDERLDESDKDDDAGVVDNGTIKDKRAKWYYHRINAYIEDSDREGLDKWIVDELKFFNFKTPESELYFVDADDQRGINCRFGMRGLVAENHFDLR